MFYNIKRAKNAKIGYHMHDFVGRVEALYFAMGIFTYIQNLFKRGDTGQAASTGTGRTPRTGGGYPLLSSVRALNVATVYRCVNLLADKVASLPMQYMRKKGDIFVEDRSDRLHYLLNIQPCSYLSAVDFWQQVVRYVLLRGNAYIVPVYDYASMSLARLALVDPTTVAHDTVTDTYTINDVYAGVSGVFDESEVIHIKNYSMDGKTGISTIAYARVALDISGTGDLETLNRFANGGNVRGIIGNDTSVRGFGEYQDKELQKLASNIDSRFRNGERIVSLPGRAQFSPISLSSTDLQFLETRKFGVREICRFFGVHPSFVFDDTSNNYKSAEMANVAFLTDTLNPMLRKIEVELHRKLVAPSLCGKRKFRFDRRELYSCDLDSRVKYQTQTIAAGLYTVNEWRLEENKPPVEGGDTVLVSANLKSIEEPAQNPDDNANQSGTTQAPDENKDNDNGEE